jgi:hypothetical protein
MLYQLSYFRIISVKIAGAKIILFFISQKTFTSFFRFNEKIIIVCPLFIARGSFMHCEMTCKNVMFNSRVDDKNYPLGNDIFPTG